MDKERKAIIKNSDMTEDMQQDAINVATKAIDSYNIEKDIACYIKKENENIRLIQINEILQYIKDNGLNNQNIILVGDFNAEPQNESIINLEKFGMKSVFDYNKLEYTSFQVRDGIDKKILDYIFYYGNLIFAEEKKSDIKIDENIGLPNEQFPSNHLYLKAMFKIN